MPELPEVETVRRGLAPAMEGARFDAVVTHRGDLRWPLPNDFVARLKGQRVVGLGRRAKYLLADLSSGDVLLMHLGMSGSFRVAQDGDSVVPGAFHYERSNFGAHDHVVFRMSSGATIAFNDPRRFGSRTSPCSGRSGPSRSATPSTPRCWRAPVMASRPA
jgi:formamidopyrimidine-DNA glycosylase